jgi:arginine decarboxylase
VRTGNAVSLPRGPRLARRFVSRFRYPVETATSPPDRPDVTEPSPGASISKATGMLIRVSSGTGIGPTRLSAFDAALRSAGVADFNLVRLSSVIPPGSTVLSTSAGDQIHGGYGDLLYCVYADSYASTPGEEAWAGMAWARRDDDSGAGLFVEHSSSSRRTVEHDLKMTLDAIGQTRPGNYHTAGSLITSVRCVDHPVCAVVIATYLARTWDS